MEFCINQERFYIFLEFDEQKFWSNGHFLCLLEPLRPQVNYNSGGRGA